MHLYTVTRGIKKQVDSAIRDLQAQYFIQTNEGQQTYTQLAVRPVQLWEFVFPKEHLATMLKTLPNANYIGKNKYIWAIQKMLGCKKIPTLDLKETKARIIDKDWVAFHHLGIKEDKFNENGTEML